MRAARTGSDSRRHATRLRPQTATIWVALGLGAAPLLAAAGSHAQGARDDVLESVRLSWVRGKGAEQCPNAQAMEQRVAANLGRNPFSGQASFELEGEVHHAGESWTATLRLSGRSGEVQGERSLAATGKSCDAMARAVVLAITLTIDPHARIAASPSSTGLGEGAPSGASASAGPSAPAPTQSAPVASVPLPTASCPLCPPATTVVRPAPSASTQKPRLSARVTPRMIAAWGALPGTALGAGLSGAAHFTARMSGDLEMFWLSEQQSEQERFGFGLTAGAVHVCYDPFASKRVETDACLAVQAGVMHATAYADEPLDPGQKLWLATGAGPRVGLAIVGDLHLELGIEALVPVVRRDFRVVGGEAHRVFLSQPVVVVGSLGLGMDFP